ncbi:MULTISPECIES: LCP family protein [unclassified Streptomyces]|uniref:LCP family protein n=1 Tax=unclassified Streptomyces TaxID=2593676 RepID=UPI00215605DB|nr:MULTISPECIES: LCP family protein [unclassified Streptomyces]
MRGTNGIPEGDEPEPVPVTRPEDLGWDDSLYDDRTTGRPGAATAPGEAGEADAVSAPEPAGSGEGPGRTDSGAEAAGDPAGPHGPEGPAGTDAADAGDGGESGHGGDGHGGKRRPRWARVLIAGSAALALVVVGAGAAGWFYVQYLNDNLTKSDLHLGDNKLDKAAPNEAGQSPLNILLLGSDARDSEENLRLGGAADTADGPPIADVQMLLHVAADRSNMTVISIPRDTRVAMPKCTDPESGREYEAVESDTINHSLQRGGPGCTVATWEELTGVPIDHFMMLDFAGVVSMADAVGGVPVCVDRALKDPKSKLDLEAGETVIKGEQALQWLRTRHGFGDGSDVGRTKAQHMYLSAMVRELQAGATLTDPAKLNSLANAATRALTVDPALGSVNRLYDLGEDLREVPNDRINMITMPWVPAPQNPEAHVMPKPGAAEELFALVREDIALDEEYPDDIASGERDGEDGDGEDAGPEADAPSEVPVTVRNGTGSVSFPAVTGRASAIVSELAALGFTGTVVDERPISQAETSLSHPAGEQAEANARLVAEALGLPERALRVSQGAETLTLVIGSDWREGNQFPERADDAEPADPPERLDSGEALKGDDDSSCMEVNPLYAR